MKHRRVLSQIALVAGVLLFSAGLQTFAAFTPPTAAPPNADAYAPINTGLDGQIKSGNLQVNALGIQGAGSALLVPYGNVGIGTVTPTAQFHVFANTQPVGAGLIDQMLIEGGSIFGNGGGYLRLQGNNPVLRFGSNLGASGNKNFQFQNGGGGFFSLGSNNDDWSWKIGSIMTWTTGGNVGIGTVNPAQRLDVNGYVKGTGLCIGTDCKTSWPSGSGPETDPTVMSWAKTNSPTIPGNVYVSGSIRAGQGTTVYSCPSASDTGCGGSSCTGGISLSSTCTYYGETGGNYGYCWISHSVGCTPIGRLLSL